MLNLFRLKKKDNNEKIRKIVTNRLKALISVYKVYKELYPCDDTINDEPFNQVLKDQDIFFIKRNIRK